MSSVVLLMVDNLSLDDYMENRDSFPNLSVMFDTEVMDQLCKYTQTAFHESILCSIAFRVNSASSLTHTNDNQKETKLRKETSWD